LALPGGVFAKRDHNRLSHGLRLPLCRPQAANTALIRLLADELGVSRSAVRLVAGATGRHKLVVAEGVSPEGIAARWPGIKL
jgi:hypothetical protein